MRISALIPLAALALASLPGCEAVSTDPDAEPLLGPEVVSDGGRLWMRAPAAQAAIAIDPAARTWSEVALPGVPSTLQAAPLGGPVVTLESTEGLLTLLGDAPADIELGSSFNRVDWTPDGTRALAWIDSGQPLEVEGSLNPGAWAVVDLSGEGQAVTRGSFGAEPLGVTFSADSRFALVRASSRLHVLDLDAVPPSLLSVPFSTDEATIRTPDLVVPSPDGRTALVTVSGRTDLFVLGLDPVAIENVVAMPGVARSIVLTPDGRQAIVATGGARVLVLDLQTFEEEELLLPHAVDTLQPSRGEVPFVLLYQVGGAEFLSRLDFTESGRPGDVETWHLEDPVSSVWMEPGEQALVIFHTGGQSWDAFVPTQSLSIFHFDSRGPSRIFLDAAAWDLVFLEGGVVDATGDPYAFVVLRDSARLVRYDLRDLSQTVFDTYDAPIAIGRVPAAEGRPEGLYVVHDEGMGLLSFVDPAAEREPPGGFPAVSGMALAGVLDRR